MKKLYKGLGILLLISVMAAAITYAIPAAWVAHQLARVADGRVQLAHARGLWHRGSGILVLSSGGGGQDAVHWAKPARWEVSSLQWPVVWRLQITLPEIGPPITATVRLDFTHWSVESTPWQGQVPLHVLSGLGAPFNTLALEGEVRINLSTLRFSSISQATSTTEPNVEIQVAGLRSAMAQGVLLGDYALEGQASTAESTFALRTIKGALLLQGNGRCMLKAQLSCSFKGSASAARHDDELLGNLLGLLGKKQSPPTGKYPVTELRW